MAEGYLLKHSPLSSSVVEITFIRLLDGKLLCYAYPSGEVVEAVTLSGRRIEILKSKRDAHKFIIKVSKYLAPADTSELPTAEDSGRNLDHQKEGDSFSDATSCCSSNTGDQDRPLQLRHLLVFSASTRKVRDSWSDAVLSWNRLGWREPRTIQAVRGCEETTALRLFVQLRGHRFVDEERDSQLDVAKTERCSTVSSDSAYTSVRLSSDHRLNPQINLRGPRGSSLLVQHSEKDALTNKHESILWKLFHRSPKRPADHQQRVDRRLASTFNGESGSDVRASVDGVQKERASFSLHSLGIRLSHLAPAH